MANWNASQDNGVISAKLLTRYSFSFALGADILKLGNRQIESKLGAEGMSGDTVYVTLADGGEVLEGDLDLTNGGTATTVYGNPNAVRKQVGVTVTPITMRYNMSQGEVDLLIKSEEFADKMTARGQERVTGKAFSCIAGAASAIDCYNATDSAKGIVDGFVKAKAGLQASKLGGQLCGVSSVWNQMAIAGAFANKGNNSTINAGDYKFDGAVKGFGGFSWATVTGAGQDETFTAKQFTGSLKCIASKSDATSNAYDILTFNAAPYTGADEGDVVDSPFTIAGVYLTDALGFKTPQLATFTGVMTGSTTIKLDHPIIDGELKNNAVPDPFGWCVIPATLTAASATNGAAATGALHAGTTYYKPVLVWVKDEFLVALKGLSPLKGQDSATIPAKFAGDKGIIPWRGTAWSDPEASNFKFRFDGLYGFRIVKGCGVKSLYIPAV